MPSDIRIDYFDVLVLYSEVNKSDARIFCDHLKKDIKLKHGESVKAVLYDECVPHAGSKFKLLQSALERCTYVFCYITKEFCEDKWTELSREECLIEAIENVEKQWCVVPVITVPTRTAKFKIPFGLRSLTNIHYYQNDQYYREKVSALIQNNLYRRLDNERKQKEQQFTWIKKNKGALHFGNEDISCQENKEKLGTKQQKNEKITEQGVNEGLIPSQPVSLQKAGDKTGTDPHTQPIGTSCERRSDDKLHCRDHFGESISEGNDSTCINSIKSTDQLSQGGSMPLLDGPNSAMVSSSINSCTEEKMPIQEDSCTGATGDIQTYREGTYSDNGYHSDQSVEPVSETNDPSDNICIKSSADQLYQGGSSNLMQPAVHKFAGNGNQSDMPLLDGLDSALAYSSINSYTGEKRHIQEECSDGARFAERLQDIGLLSLNPDVDGMHSKSDDQSQDNHLTPVNQSPSCWGTEVTVEEEEDQSLETNSKDESMSVKKTKEKKEQHLETKSKDHSMLETKSKDHSMSVKKSKEKKEQHLETKSKDHSMLETKSKDHSMSVKKTQEEKEQHLETNLKDHSMLETKSKVHSMSVKKTKEEEEQSLETKSKDHSMLETKSKDHSMLETNSKDHSMLETKLKDHSMLETNPKDHSMSVKKTQEEKEQHLETNLKDHSMLETKSKVHSMSVKKTKEEEEQSLETKSKDHSMLETKSKDHSMLETNSKDHSMLETKLKDHSMLETNPKDHSMPVKKTKEEEEQSLETKSKDHSMLETKSKHHIMSVKKTKEEEEQSLETKSKDCSMSVKKIKEGNEHYSSLSEKDFASEMKKKDQDVHLWHRANGSNKKQVAAVTPRLKVCKDGDGEKTDLDIVDRETNGDTGVKTIHETRETTSHEMEQTLPKTVDGDISEILPVRERPYTDLSRYHVAMRPVSGWGRGRPATPLLAKASPIPPVTLFAVKSTCLVQSDPTSVQCTESSKGILSQDELD